MAIYKVGSDGKAPKGLKKGDQVVTGGGTYTITGGDYDSGYQTASTKDANQTTRNYTGTYSDPETAKVTLSDYGTRQQTNDDYTSYVGKYRDQLDDIANSLLGSKFERTSSYEGQIQDAIDRLNSQEFNHTPQYTDEINAAIAALQNQQFSYDSQYQDRINAALEALQNSKFEYDLDSDPIYSSLRKQYLREADRATEDTMATAAAMTGGIPSTAAINAASQAGDYYKTQLSDSVPDLYSLAYSMYNDGLNNQRSDISTLIGLDQQAYGQAYDAYGLENNKILNTLNAYNGLEDRAYNQAYDLYGLENNKILNTLNAYSNLDATEYQHDLDSYNSQNSNMLNAYNILSGLDAQDYQAYQDNRQWDYNQQAYQDSRDDEMYSRTQSESKAAYERVMEKLQYGITPSDSELSAAGVTSSEAATMLAYIQAQATSGGSRSSGGGSGGSSGSNTSAVESSGGGFDALFKAMAQSGNPDNFLSTNYKQYGVAYRSISSVLAQYYDWYAEHYGANKAAKATANRNTDNGATAIRQSYANRTGTSAKSGSNATAEDAWVAASQLKAAGAKSSEINLALDTYIADGVITKADKNSILSQYKYL